MSRKRNTFLNECRKFFPGCSEEAILWWKRHPIAKNPAFVVLMLPLVFMMFIAEWLDGLRDTHNPVKKV